MIILQALVVEFMQMAAHLLFLVVVFLHQFQHVHHRSYRSRSASVNDRNRRNPVDELQKFCAAVFEHLHPDLVQDRVFMYSTQDGCRS